MIRFESTMSIATVNINGVGSKNVCIMYFFRFLCVYDAFFVFKKAKANEIDCKNYHLLVLKSFFLLQVVSDSEYD